MIARALSRGRYLFRGRYLEDVARNAHIIPKVFIVY